MSSKNGVEVDETKEPRFRKATFSLRANRISEGMIIEGIKALDKQITGSAYILHDNDKYMVDEVEDIARRHSEMIESGKPAEELEAIPVPGAPKPPHFHVLLAFKQQMRLSTLCRAFGLDWQKEGNLINRVNGTNGYLNMLAYLTHITPMAIAEGKTEYSPEDVKLLKFPQLKGKDEFNKCRSYAQFAEAYQEKEFLQDDILHKVAHGKMTLREAMETDVMYYIENRRKLETARSTYLVMQDPPNTTFNYYVGTYEGDESGAKGGIGKSLACEMIAVSMLSQMYPDKDFSVMDSNDLVRGGYIYRAGGHGVEYQDYDGQPIIIWEDMRAYSFIKLFGGAGNFFDAFDIHPKGVRIHILYGETKLINRVNIINGIEPYGKFIDGLSQEYRNELGGFSPKEDKSQAIRRIPTFLEVSPESISVTMQLQYFFQDMPILSYKFTNSLKTAIEHKQPFRKEHLAVTQPIIDKVNEIEERYEERKDEEPPEGLFQILEPLHEVAPKDTGGYVPETPPDSYYESRGYEKVWNEDLEGWAWQLPKKSGGHTNGNT